MFNRAVTFGRFNLPHNGHLHLWEIMRELGKKVLVIVSSAPSNLPLEERVRVVEKMAPWLSITSSNSPFGLVGEKDVLVLGQDQEKFSETVTRITGCSSFLVRRMEDAPSSSLVRKYIEEGDIPSLVSIVKPELMEDIFRLRENELERKSS